MLQIKQVEMHFGGVKALTGISFDIAPGQIVAVIGPNGAGKTTLFNVVSGLYRPTSGSVRWDGNELVGLPPHRLAGLGIARTFQNPQVFDGSTVLQSVQIGSHIYANRSLLGAFLRPPGYRRDEARLREQCDSLLDFVGLRARSQDQANSLSYGELKKLDLARAMAAKPNLLLMDEPAAGLNPSETEQLKQLILKIASSGVTVVLVEHDMKLVMDVSDHIVVLNHGQVLTQGKPVEVRNDPQVLTAYLGAQSLEVA